MNAPAVNEKLLHQVVASLPRNRLAAIRRAAAAQFSATGFPTLRHEDWKYTSLDDAADLSNAWLRDVADNPGRLGATGSAVAEFGDLQERVDAHWIAIRDGVVDGAALAALQSVLGADISLESLSDGDALQSTDGEAPMSLFNAALLQDGLQITLRANVSSAKPIGLLLVDGPETKLAQTRVNLVCGENSHLRIIECCVSAGPGRQFTNSVVTADIKRGAKLDHVRIQNRHDDHIGVHRMTATLQRDAVLRFNSYDFGGALTRNDIVADITEQGASVDLHGLYLASGEQHIDNHTSVLHKVGPSRSVEEYRGILTGRSRCVFNGKAIVSPGADGTDASQTNHNLLLSDRAEIDTKPELEIYADEVKCSHGATVGQLDEAALFYLRSRGLDPLQARNMLTRAFAAKIMSALAIDECREYLGDALEQRLATLVDEQDERTK